MVVAGMAVAVVVATAEAHQAVATAAAIATWTVTAVAAAAAEGMGRHAVVVMTPLPAAMAVDVSTLSCNALPAPSCYISTCNGIFLCLAAALGFCEYLFKFQGISLASLLCTTQGKTPQLKWGLVVCCRWWRRLW